MTGTPGITAAEAFHLAYDVFIFTVETLALAPDAQCEAMGDYNTAWELRDDVLAGRALSDSGLLTASQASAVVALVEAVRSVPVDDMPAGAGRAPNVAAMQHPAWSPIRESSRALLETLSSVTDAHRARTAAQANAF